MELIIPTQISAIISTIKTIKSNYLIRRKLRNRRSIWYINYLFSSTRKNSPCVWKLPRSEDFFINTLTWPNTHFHKVFRMRRSTFFEIVERVTPLLRREFISRRPIPVAERVAIALYYLKSGADYSCVADVFGKSKASVCNIIEEFTTAMIKVYYQESFNFPRTEQEQKTIADQFLFNWQFPTCVGALDGTHIPIITPKIDGSDYYNYKNWHSILLLLVCDSKFRIMYMNCGYPGKVSDGGAFSASKLGFELKNSNLLNEPFTLVADAAFPLLSGCMKPYPGSNLTEDQKNFNYRLSRARMTVEATIGRVKGRWRSLLKRCDLEVEKTVKVITTCCILHNIVESKNEIFLPNWLEEVVRYNAVFPQPNQVYNDHQEIFNGDPVSRTNLPKNKRDILCDLLITTYPV